eukprot:CAMPEP_0202365346 /NCGR_PEP_ID=MMETSP1126-20121109/16388_1 /ASSEMBLY_ACC=CAM_ASM_000457 /TAXON_ID=3047 /ORGANISM="Dunaliella tertiolecta, Strain CCMP1320" /LENGTH=122 /DNA_ID=CAMNT_0048960165 /DNA_START=809 /DNA_END=1177 /DNA_ORIENTATION=-
MTSSVWKMAISGPSWTSLMSPSVTMQAISMIVSHSTFKPVISKSIHTSGFASFLGPASLLSSLSASLVVATADAPLLLANDTGDCFTGSGLGSGSPAKIWNGLLPFKILLIPLLCLRDCINY